MPCMLVCSVFAHILHAFNLQKLSRRLYMYAPLMTQKNQVKCLLDKIFFGLTLMLQFQSPPSVFSRSLQRMLGIQINCYLKCIVITLTGVWRHLFGVQSQQNVLTAFFFPQCSMLMISRVGWLSFVLSYCLDLQTNCLANLKKMLFFFNTV